MNAERLHAVVNSLKGEMDEKRLVNLMQALVNALRALVQQATPSNQQNLVSARTNLIAALENSPIDDFSPAWRQLLKDMDGEEFFGKTLKERVTSTLANNQMTPAVAAEDLDRLRQAIEKFHGALDSVSSAFETLKIGDQDLNPGECEVGELIPRQAINDRLAGFIDELKELEFILNTFSEVATGSPEELALKTISSTDLLIYIMISPASAACLAKAIGEVAGFYKTLLEIRKLNMEIRKQGVPDNAAKGIEDYANQHMESGIGRLTRDIIKQFYKGEEGRRNELTNAVKFALEKIAYRIDHGFNLEVRCEPLADGGQTKEAAEVNKALAAVRAASSNMQFMNLEGRPLLRLPEEKASKANSVAPPKTRKKKGRTRDYEQEAARAITLDE